MKFTYTQKKWALTGVLLAVLGFNVSMNKHTDGIASADFASESGDLVESKIVTADGVFKVKYIKSGDKEVMAVIPKVTEGKTCDVCGTTYTLDASLDKNKSNIDELNVQLLKQLAKGKPKLTTRQASLEAAPREEEVDETEYADRVDKIEAQCASKAKAKESALCLTDKISRLIPKKSGSENAKILNLINRKIIPVVGTELTDLRTEATETGDIETLQLESNDALKPLKEIADAGKRDYAFTNAYIGLQANLLIPEFKKIKELEKIAISKAGTYEGLAAAKEAKDRKTETANLVAKLVDAQILLSTQSLQKQFISAQDFEEKKMISETMERANAYTKLLTDNMAEIAVRYTSNALPAPGTTPQVGGTQNTAGVRGAATRDGSQLTSGGITATPAPTGIRSAGAPGPIEAPIQGVPTAPMTGYQLQSQSQDALAPRVQLTPRGF